METWKLNLMQVAYQRQIILRDIFEAWVEVILFKLNKGIITVHRFEAEVTAVKQRPGLCLSLLPDEHPTKSKYKVITKYLDGKWISVGFKSTKEDSFRVYFETDKAIVTDALNSAFIKNNLGAIVNG